MPDTFQTIHTVKVYQNRIYLDDVLLYESEGNSHDMAMNLYKLQETQYPKFFKMDLMSRWGVLCADLLLHHENLDAIDVYKRVLVLQNASSSLVSDKKFQETVNNSLPSPAQFVYTLPNIVLGEIAIRHHFKGENTFFVSPSFNEVQLNQYVQYLFDNHVAEIALCGFLEVTDTTQDIEMYICKKR